MGMIKRRLWLRGLTAGAACILLLCLIVLKQYLPAGVAAGVAIIGIVFFARGVRVYASAKLVIDNRIIGICPATISASGDNAASARQVIECVLSPFGLLVGSNVYKFGRDGIRLYTIDIGDSCISVDFGSEAQRWTATLLHEPLSQEDVSRLVEKAAYETGITPSLSGTKCRELRKELP